MESNGWIKLHRKFIESPLWKFSINSQLHYLIPLWAYCLLSANWEEKRWYDGKEEIIIPAGTLITSISHLSSALSLSPQKIRTGLKHIENMSMITLMTTNRWTSIKIVNWVKYQSIDITDNKRITNGKQTDNKRITTTKEYKNIRNKEYKKEEVVVPSENSNKRKILLTLNDQNFIKEKSDQFNIDTNLVIEEIRLCADWWEESQKKLEKPKAAINNWLKRVSPLGQAVALKSRIAKENKATDLPVLSEEERNKAYAKLQKMREEYLEKTTKLN